MPTINRQIAAWLSACKPGSLPPDVIQVAKLRTLDIIGAMVASRDTEIAKQLAQAGRSNAADAIPMVGVNDKAQMLDAALLMGSTACAMEFDDSHVSTGLHASSPVVGAALAYGLQNHSSGMMFLEAVAIGVELTCRLGLVSPGSFHRVGFHPTAVLAVFGTTYAIARMAGLSEDEIRNATGLAGSLSSGIMSSWEDGTSAKTLHGGWSSTSGLTATRLAKFGITGPDAVFEGRFGFFRTHVQSQQEFDFTHAVAGLGESWELFNIAPRLFPSGHYMQAFQDAALNIVRNNDVAIENIERIVCNIAGYMIPLLCEPFEEKCAPKTSWHARYSLPFCLAECLVSKEFGKDSLKPESLTDSRYLELCKKFSCTEDVDACDRTKWSGEVTLLMKDGTSLHHRIEHLRGTPQNPMTANDVIVKFLKNVDGFVSADDATIMVDKIMNIDKEADIRPVFDLFRSFQKDC